MVGEHGFGNPQDLIGSLMGLLHEAKTTSTAAQAQAEARHTTLIETIQAQTEAMLALVKAALVLTEAITAHATVVQAVMTCEGDDEDESLNQWDRN